MFSFSFVRLNDKVYQCWAEAENLGSHQKAIKSVYTYHIGIVYGLSELMPSEIYEIPPRVTLQPWPSG